MSQPTNIAVLGSTGSIGRNALAVARELPGCQVFGLTGHKQVDLLAEQTQEFSPRFVVATNESIQVNEQFAGINGLTLLTGREGINQLVSEDQVDTVVAAIVGRAGLESTWTAVEKGKRVALANKETLVMAGGQIMELARSTEAEIIPVDSEHSAIFQCLRSGQAREVSQLILTASGGPFLDYDSSQMKCVTVEQALAHPTWNMGKKITIDSATMMNKALEIIEARWLFDVPADQISVMIHPQSIVHSMVEFCDGSIISQMSPPDMKLPIQYALTYPERVAGPSPRLDLSQSYQLDLHPPDMGQFPALGLGYEVAERGGTTGTVLNAANEAAVDAFLNGQISFTDIVAACREILNNHHFESNPKLDTLLSLDVWARQEINKWIAC